MTRKRKLRRSTEMYPLIEAWVLSGQSKSEFCAGHNLRLNTFSYWHKKYAKEKKEEEGGDFVRLEIDSSPDSMTCGVRVDYGAGVFVEFTSLPPTSYLVSVLKGLESC